MGAGQHEFSSLGNFRVRKLRLELLQVFESLSVLLGPVESCSQQQIGVIEQIRFWIGCQKPAEHRDGFFRLPSFDQPLRLEQRRVIRGDILGLFGRSDGLPDRLTGEHRQTQYEGHADDGELHRSWTEEERSEPIGHVSVDGLAQSQR